MHYFARHVSGYVCLPSETPSALIMNSISLMLDLGSLSDSYCILYHTFDISHSSCNYCVIIIFEREPVGASRGW